MIPETPQELWETWHKAGKWVEVITAHDGAKLTSLRLKWRCAPWVAYSQAVEEMPTATDVHAFLRTWPIPAYTPDGRIGGKKGVTLRELCRHGETIEQCVQRLNAYVWDQDAYMVWMGDE